MTNWLLAIRSAHRCIALVALCLMAAGCRQHLVGSWQSANGRVVYTFAHGNRGHLTLARERFERSFTYFPYGNRMDLQIKNGHQYVCEYSVQAARTLRLNCLQVGTGELNRSWSNLTLKRYVRPNKQR